MKLMTVYTRTQSHKADEGLQWWRGWNQTTDWTQMGVVQCMSHGATAPFYAYPPYDAPARSSLDDGRVHCIPDTSPTGWGNDAIIDSIDKAVAWLTATAHCRDDKVCLFAASMGTLAACNWARTHLDRVAAIALCVPAVDLADLHDRTSLGYTAEIEAAYGGAAGYTAALPTHNPTQFAATLTALPFKIWYSSNDPIIDPTKVQAFAAVVGAELVVNPAPGGHDVTAAPGPDIAAFFSAHTPPAPTGGASATVNGQTIPAGHFGIPATGQPYATTGTPEPSEAATLRWDNGPVLVH